MAETVEIRIPVTLDDKTSAGISSINRKVTTLEKSFDKASRALNNLLGNHTVHLTASDTATPKIADVEGAASQLDNYTADIYLAASDAATDIIKDAMDAASDADGTEATTYLEADDAASSVIEEVSAAANELDGRTVSIIVDANNAADSALNSAASTARSGIAGAMAAAGVSLGAADAVQTFASFEAGMSQVAAISGATGAELDSLTEKAKYMGATTKFTATESSEAFNYMAMAGWKTGDMLDGIEGIMNLAAASGEDLGTTSDIVTDALTAFGLSASDSTHFADVLAQTASNANTNVSMMGESFKYVAPLAGAMNYSIEDVSQALGIMANAGVKSSMAGTSLRRIITNLVSPTDKEAAAMEKYGIRLTDNEGRTKSLMGIMENMRDSLSGLSEEEQTAAASAIFGKQALSGALAIVNASEEDFQSLSEAIGSADGASERMADTMLDNLSGSITLMQSALDGVKISLGEGVSPYLKNFIDSITGALPDAQAAVEEFFGQLELDISAMTSSEKWQNADTFGKIDIAWDTLIVQPFSEWATDTGLPAVQGIFSDMMSSALKILPGGEGPGLTSWLSLGAITLGLTKIVDLGTKVQGAVEAISGLSVAGTTLGEFAGAAAGVAGPVVAAAVGLALLGVAIDKYNEKKIENNLADHFGNLELTAEQTKDLAETIVPISNVTAELEVANVKFAEGTDLQAKAEAELEKIKVLNWKVQRVQLEGGEMSDEDIALLQESAKTLTDTLVQKLQADEEGSNAFVSAILGTKPEASEIATQLSEWFDIDEGQVSSIGESIKSLMQSSIEDGIESIETATAISLLQAKQMEIATGAKAAQLQGKLDWLSITSSGAALTPESWANVTGQVGSYIQAFQQEDALAYEQFLGQLAMLQKNDPSRAGEIAQIKQLISDANSEMVQTSIGQGWSWLYTSLHDSYGQEMDSAAQPMEESVNGYIEQFNNVINKALSGDLDAGQAQSALTTLFENITTGGISTGLESDTQGALLDRFQYMLPTVDAMRNAIDGYIRNGEPVPQMLMDAYSQSMTLGAMAGDQENGSYAGYMAQHIAEQFADRDEFESAMTQAGISMADYTSAFGDSFESELNRAFAQTAEGSTGDLLSQIMESMSDPDKVNWGEVATILEGAGYSIREALEEQGIDLSGANVPVTGDISIADLAQNLTLSGATLTGVSEEGAHFNLEPGKTIWSIAGEIVGEGSDPSIIQTVSDRILEANGWTSEDATTLAPQTVTIPADVVLEYNPVGGEETPTVASPEAEAQATVTAGETDASQVPPAVEEDTQTAMDEDPPEVTGNANVTVAQENNADEVRSGVENDLQSVFSGNIPVSAHAVVNVTWELANGLNAVTSSDGASVPISVGLAHSAVGRFVDSPMLSWIGEDGPEFVIPVGSDKRDRGLDLWMAAGEALGVGAFADGGAVDVSGTVPSWARTAAEAYGYGGSSGGGSSQPVNVQVSMNPVITVSGSNLSEERLMEMIRAHLAEISDSVAGELAAKLETIFKNMPTEVA